MKKIEVQFRDGGVFQANDALRVIIEATLIKVVLRNANYVFPLDVVRIFSESS